MKERRAYLNEYHQTRRRESKEAKFRAKEKLVDPNVFLTNAMLLMTVGLWIKTVSESYARAELAKTGVRDAGINKIIKAANEYLATAPCDY